MRTHLLIAAMLPLTVAACNPDPDEDGLTSAEEKELGLDHKVADSDGDGLTDGEEVLEFGTDPLSPDSDGEGFTDGEEIDAGTDPLNPAYWPDDGSGWPDNTDLLEDADFGWNIGLQVGDFEAEDVAGETVSFHQFAGHVVILDLSAGWCGPCRAAAMDAEELWQAHREEGLLLVHLMIDDNTRGGGVTDGAFLQSWADEYGLRFPVLHDPDQVAYAGFAQSGAYDGGIPWFAVLDRNLVVRTTGRGPAIEQAAIELLSE